MTIKTLNVRMPHGPVSLIVLAACGLAGSFVLGCEKDGLADGLPPEINCSTCHGRPENPAPPVSLSDSNETTVLGVGAHQAHMRENAISRKIECTECHLVPESVDAYGHMDSALPAEITWGELAKTEGLDPIWDRENERCFSTYCHGASLSGGSNTEPKWTVVDGTQANCGSCHGNPPAAPHPMYTDCDRCHPDTVDESGQIILATGRHIDGILDSVAPACNACHGGPGSPAPPVDTRGNSATTGRGVGAHREHLGPSDWRAEIGCDECHLVPSLLQDPGHADTMLPAELTWGALATADRAQPGFDQATATCSGIYCHGATLKGTGSNRSPNWTNVGAGEATCGTCHGNPPESGGHPQIDDCTLCHACVAEDARTIREDGAYLHINGENNLERLGSCPPP